MEGDTTVRRIKDHRGAAQSPRPPQYNNGESWTTRRRKEEEEEKPEVLLLLREGPGASLVAGFLLVLWLLVHMSLRQLVLGSSTGDFNALRAR